MLSAIVARFPHCHAVVLSSLPQRDVWDGNSHNATDAGIEALASGCPQLRELGVEETEQV